MHACGTSTLALQKRTSIGKPLPAVERLVVVATAAAATPRPRIVEPWPPPSMATAIERPVRGEEGTRQHVIVGWLGERGAEFEAWLQPRTS